MENTGLKAKILIVEDDLKILFLLRETLEKEGYTVISTSDGKDAIEHAALHQPDLVILDGWLPNVDGFEICQKLRELSEVPILMLSGQKREADKLRGLSCGADDYLIKPFSPKELAARVKIHLKRHIHPPLHPPQKTEELKQDPLGKLRG